MAKGLCTDMSKPPELLLYEGAVLNTARYALRKKREYEEAVASLNEMLTRLERMNVAHGYHGVTPHHINTHA